MLCITARSQVCRNLETLCLYFGWIFSFRNYCKANDFLVHLILLVIKAVFRTNKKIRKTKINKRLPICCLYGHIFQISLEQKWIEMKRINSKKTNSVRHYADDEMA